MSKSSPTTTEVTGEMLPLVARAAIDEKITGKPSKDPVPELNEYLAEARGVLIALYDKDGEERVCAGSTVAEHGDLIEETRHSALAALEADDQLKDAKDRRISNRLTISVAVITEPQRVESIIDLDPEVYGVVLSAVKRGVSGIMLPRRPGLNTVDKQLAAIRRRYSLRPDEYLKIERFRADIFTEGDA